MTPSSLCSFIAGQPDARCWRSLATISLLLAVSANALAAADPIGALPEIDLPAKIAAAEFERDLARTCVELAAKGDVEGAWGLLAADQANPERLAFRVVTVSAFLRNQGSYSESGRFGTFALRQSWTDVRNLRLGSERAEVAYWCAWIAKEILDDRSLALAWVKDAEQQDPASERNRMLREQLEALSRTDSEDQP